MAGLTVHARLEGLEPLLKKLGDPRVEALAKEHMLRSVQMVEKEARLRAPVNTGQLRSSIVSFVNAEMKSITGVVGSPVAHAPYMEFGTGSKTEWPGGGKGEHSPPGPALDLWALRHGYGKGAGWIIAAKIRARGGLVARKFLRGAFEDKTEAIKAEMTKLLEDVIEVLRK